MSTDNIHLNSANQSWVREKIFLGQSFGAYVKGLITPFNIIALLILWVGIPTMIVRFGEGLAATTNLTDNNPWGIWIGFDVMSGVALAAGGFVVSAAVYVFGLKEYRPILRAAVLTGFLGYGLVVIGLLFDLGRPWRLPFPMFVSMGVTSVLFLVAWHVALYLTCQLVEFSPAIFEWTGWKKWRKWAIRIALGATIFGIMLSTLHQSALGALFLLMPTKVHPLWYSPLIPVFFIVSAVVAGICMVIVESMLSHRIFVSNHDPIQKEKMDKITLGLGKAAAMVLFPYFWLKILGVMHSNSWSLLGTPLGYWFLVELIGFVALPCTLFILATRNRNVTLVRFTAVIAVIGIVINRLNLSIIAFRWDAPDRYIPAWPEIVITITLVTMGLLVYKWIVNRLPVLKPHPEYGDEH
ncbi:NrfD/PsrC family molybdoenzyme membrane anchor subunit [Chloroflexota bacterium]